MKNKREKRHPFENTNPMLETDTLNRFHAPVVFITYNGIKKADIKQIDTYKLHTSAGTFHKTDVLYLLLADAARKLGDKLRVNAKVESENLRTAYRARERTKAVDSKRLRRAQSHAVKVTMRNGHVLYGTVVEYNAYNFTMNVNEQLVLLYKHAVYEFLLPKRRT